MILSAGNDMDGDGYQMIQMLVQMDMVKTKAGILTKPMIETEMDAMTSKKISMMIMI